MYGAGEDKLMFTTIDSIQVFIPISRIAMTGRQSNKHSLNPIIPIEIKDERLSSDVISYYEATGEIANIKQFQPITINSNGISTGYRIIRKSIGPSTVTGLSLGFTSKMLESEYLQRNINQYHQTNI